MINKKYFLLILIILALFCLISSVSAENNDLIDNSNNSISDESNSLSLEDDTNQNVINISATTDTPASNQKVNSISATTNAPSASNQNTVKKSGTVIKKTPNVWINKMIVKSNKKLVIILKSDKKGKIYYTTNGKMPTVHSRIYTGPIVLPSDKVLRFFYLLP